MIAVVLWLGCRPPPQADAPSSSHPRAEGDAVLFEPASGARPVGDTSRPPSSGPASTSTAAVDASCRGRALDWDTLLANPACRTTPAVARAAPPNDGLMLSAEVSPKQLRSESLAQVAATLRNTTTSPMIVRVVAPMGLVGPSPIEVEVETPLAIAVGPTPVCGAFGADVANPEPVAIAFELAAGGTLAFPSATAEFRLPPIDESCSPRPFPAGRHTVHASIELSAGKRVGASATVEVIRRGAGD